MESGTEQTHYNFFDRIIRGIPAAETAKMTDYRVYFIGDDGHFLGAVNLDCPDDEAAKEYAKQFINGHDIELWQRDRIIAKFDRKPE